MTKKCSNGYYPKKVGDKYYCCGEMTYLAGKNPPQCCPAHLPLRSSWGCYAQELAPGTQYIQPTAATQVCKNGNSINEVNGKKYCCPSGYNSSKGSIYCCKPDTNPAIEEGVHVCCRDDGTICTLAEKATELKD